MKLPSHTEMKNLTDQQLREKLDELSASTVVGAGFIYDGLRHRQLARMTSKMLIFTIAVTVATFVNLALVALALFC